MPQLCRAVGEQGDPGADIRYRKCVGYHCGLCFLRGQEVDDGVAVVGSTGATDFMKLGVQQLVQSRTIAPDSWVVEFDF